MYFDTPILIITYNRVSNFNNIKKYLEFLNAKNIYIFSDGPKENKLDKLKVANVREKIETVLSKFSIKKKYSDKNLGCKDGVVCAINWFFENVDYGIILEDDLIPSKSFFIFCEKLLKKYENTSKIMHIGGFKYSFIKSNQYSYNFTRFSHVWGWATWKRAWSKYNEDIIFKSNIENLLMEINFGLSKKEILIRKKVLEKIKNKELDTWDYIWDTNVQINSGFAIRPNVNLVTNVGFNNEATHTTKKIKFIEDSFNEEIEFPLHHPVEQTINNDMDKQFVKKIINPTFFNKLMIKLKINE